MAGTTYRFLANLVLDKINENSDDSSLSINHIIFWIKIAANRMRLDRSNKRFNSGAYLVLIQRVPVVSAGRKKYFELPELILDLDRDNGINAIVYNEDSAPDGIDVLLTKFERTTPAAAHILYSVPIRRPTPSQPFFYRLNSRIQLLGIEDVIVEFLDMFLFTAVDPSEMVSLDDNVPVEEDQIAPLYAAVMQLIGFGIPSVPDKENDGSDSSAVVMKQQQQRVPQSQPDTEQQ